MLKVGLVGCGFMGKMHMSVYKVLEGVEVIEVSDSRPEKAARLAEDTGIKHESDFGGLIANPDIDIIDICLPTYLHAETAIQAMHAGKHVICEKPMALHLDDADRMIAAARESGKRFMIAHCIRFWPEYAELKRAVDDGRYGQLQSLNLTRYGQFPTWSSDNWLGNPDRSGGGVMDMHIHDTDFAHYLLGIPNSLYAKGTIDSRGPSHVFTTMEFGPTIVHLEGGWNLPENTPFEMSYRAIFERGALIYRDGKLTVYRDGCDPQGITFESMAAEGGGNISNLGGYYHELKYFTDCVRDGVSVEVAPPVSSRLSLETVLEEIRQIQHQHR